MLKGLGVSSHLPFFMNRIFIVIFLLCFFFTNGQEKNQDYFFGLDYGIQMSGIKSEDFISSNYSSLIRLNAGKWLNRYVGVKFSYQGRHFYAIADDFRHSYDFYSIEGMVSLKQLFTKKNLVLHDFVLRGGVGLFKNYYYNNSSIHLNLGLQNSFSISKSLAIKLDVGAIIGWDIYQGDQDILPNTSLGLLYFFNL